MRSRSEFGVADQRMHIFMSVPTISALPLRIGTMASAHGSNTQLYNKKSSQTDAFLRLRAEHATTEMPTSRPPGSRSPAVKRASSLAALRAEAIHSETVQVPAIHCPGGVARIVWPGRRNGRWTDHRHVASCTRRTRRHGHEHRSRPAAARSSPPKVATRPLRIALKRREAAGKGHDAELVRPDRELSSALLELAPGGLAQVVRADAKPRQPRRPTSGLAAVAAVGLDVRHRGARSRGCWTGACRSPAADVGLKPRLQVRASYWHRDACDPTFVGIADL